MSADNSEKPTPKINISMDTIANAMLSRVEKYGLATVLLLMLIYWAKPHADEMIRSHGKLIEKTVEVQATQASTLSQQAKTLETATKTLERVDRISVDTNTAVNEIRSGRPLPSATLRQE